MKPAAIACLLLVSVTVSMLLTRRAGRHDRLEGVADRPPPAIPFGLTPVDRGSDGSRWLIIVRIDDYRPALFMVDTGAPNTYVFSGNYSYPSRRMYEAGFPFAGGVRPCHEIVIGRLEFAGMAFDNFPARQVSLPELEVEGIAGIIGHDLLSQFTVEFDPSARRIAFWRPTDQ